MYLSIDCPILLSHNPILPIYPSFLPYPILSSTVLFYPCLSYPIPCLPIVCFPFLCCPILSIRPAFSLYIYLFLSIYSYQSLLLYLFLPYLILIYLVLATSNLAILLSNSTCLFLPVFSYPYGLPGTRNGLMLMVMLMLVIAVWFFVPIGGRF